MSAEKARELYQQLTPEQKHFVEHKTINTTLSIKHWIVFLSRTSKYDRLRDDTSNTLLAWIVILIIATVVLAIVALNSASWRYVLAALAAVGIVLFLLVRMRIALGKRNVSNYLRFFFLPILHELRSKAGDDAKMVAALDFRDPVKSLPFEQINEPELSREIKLYTPKMITAGVMLKDETYMEVVLMDEVRKMKITRRKTKFKTKVTHRLFIRLTVKKSIYQRSNVTLPPYVEVEDQPDHFVFKLKYKEKAKSLGMEILEPRAMVAQMAVLYGLFTLLPGASFSAASDPTRAQDAVQDMFWNDQIFNQYDRDGFSRSRLGRGFSSSRGRGSAFES